MARITGPEGVDLAGFADFASDMVPSFGELLTRWTVRLALAGYFVGAGLRTAREPNQRRVARAAWTLGCLFSLVHFACAFHFFHHWSHAAALQRTADQTAQVTGWHWGGGIYFNYLFTLLWAADVIALWLSPPDGHRTRNWLEVALQAFMWFMVFNATVVFGQGAIRWFGLAGCGWLLVLAGQRFAHGRHKR